VGALSTGVVHALGSLRGLGARNWVQADVRLAPGNSGGPLADAQGRVIGINTMVAGGLALAVPSNTVAHFLRTGVLGPSLGIVVQAVRVDKGIGFVVLEISAGSPAAAASLFVGDVLIGAGGRPFRSLGDLEQALEDTEN